jgi:hypothetical protein
VSVSERFAKASDMDAEVSFLHNHVRPYSRNQFVAGYDFSSPFDQSDKDVERATANRKRLVRFLKQPFGRNQTKWAK